MDKRKDREGNGTSVDRGCRHDGSCFVDFTKVVLKDCNLAQGSISIIILDRTMMELYRRATGMLSNLLLMFWCT